MLIIGKMLHKLCFVVLLLLVSLAEARSDSTSSDNFREKETSLAKLLFEDRAPALAPEKVLEVLHDLEALYGSKTPLKAQEKARKDLITSLANRSRIDSGNCAKALRLAHKDMMMATSFGPNLSNYMLHYIRKQREACKAAKSSI